MEFSNQVGIQVLNLNHRRSRELFVLWTISVGRKVDVGETQNEF